MDEMSRFAAYEVLHGLANAYPPKMVRGVSSLAPTDDLTCRFFFVPVVVLSYSPIMRGNRYLVIYLRL